MAANRAGCAGGLKPVDATSRRLRLVVAYDGQPFQGWQSQAHGDTVQDRLEAAFSALCEGHRIPVHGSGRTDAGVHARGQVAHADVPADRQHTPERWRGALNAHLPPAIRVMAVRFAHAGFHARHSVTGKIYRYRIWTGPVLDPLEIGRAWHVSNQLDTGALQSASGLLIGKHDFAAFAANRGKPDENTERTIKAVTLRHRGPLLTLDFEGDGFLYKMVRLLTGSLVRCAQGKATADWIAGLLGGQQGKTTFAAPADGLYLLKVLYRDRDAG